MRLPPKIQELIDSVLNQAGAFPVSFRKALIDKVSSVGGDSKNGDIPENLKSYVNKVATCAYKITDEDFDKLRKAGYSDDQIYEITISAAFAAGLVRLETGMRALEKEK
jgi:hypothetical protein